jgi:Protein of unknown function (DUF3540)
MTNISAIRPVASHAVSLDDVAADGRLANPPDHAATVVVRNGRDVQFERDGHIGTARVAFGCIVQPEPGDRVLTAIADGTIWVTAVLERPSDAPMRLWAEGDISIGSLRGDVSLIAGGSVNLDAAQRTRIAAPEIDLHAGVARFVLDELVQVGRKASLCVKQIRHFSEMIETFAEHVLVRAQRGSRFIEESDQLRAGDIDHRAESTLQMRAKSMFMTADTVVRVDADQIHMG